MEKKLLTEGLIINTKDGNIKWSIKNEYKDSFDYRGRYNIGKEIRIDFYYDKENMSSSVLLINIRDKYGVMKNYKYIYVKDIGTKMMKELSKIISTNIETS